MFLALGKGCGIWCRLRRAALWYFTDGHCWLLAANLAVLEVDDELPPCLLSHDWWPLLLLWFPGPLCQHVSGWCQ